MLKVGIIGNFNLDIMIGSVLDTPKFDQEILAESYVPRVAGTAGYMALALKALEVEPIIVSTIGKDYYGEFLISELQNQSILTKGINVLEGHQTPVGFVVSKVTGDRAIISVSGAHDYFNLQTYQDKKELIKDCTDIVICGTYLLPNFTVTEAKEVAKEQQRLGKRVYFDPSWDPNGWNTDTCRETLELSKYVDVFMMNETEVCHLTGKDNWKDAAKVISAYCNEVIVKLGSKGAAALINGNFIHVPLTKNVNAFDTTGAGDIFDMGYLVARRKNYTTEDSLHFANKLATLVISQEKSRQYPTLGEVVRASKE